MNRGTAGANPTASVVVAVHGNVRDLDGLLDALSCQEPAGAFTEVVIVDNHPRPQLPMGFGDGRIPGCEVRIVHEPTVGLSRARNAGIRAASGTYVLITDPDSRPRERWAHELVTAIHESGAFCAGGRTIAAFRAPGRASAHVPPQVLGQYVPLAWPKHQTTLREPYWLIGCNMAFRKRPSALFREELGAVGAQHLSCEDLEFVIRAQIAGDDVIVVPEAVVERAIHPRDLRARQIIHRAYWHGVSMARVHQIHGASHFYDSYRLQDALRRFVCDLAERLAGNRVVPVMDLARVTGFRIERYRLANSPASPRSNPK